MARGGARPGAGRKARKSANTSPPSRRARARARVETGNQRPWPADKVERWAIERLIPYAKNARTHTDAQVAAIAASIKEWGWTTPALVGEDGGLIAGHARVLAARQLGIAEIPVMVDQGTHGKLRNRVRRRETLRRIGADKRNRDGDPQRALWPRQGRRAPSNCGASSPRAGALYSGGRKPATPWSSSASRAEFSSPGRG
jgi:hypothetical protein